MAMKMVNTWVIIAGVRVHGRIRTIPAAIQATPIATMASTAMTPTAFDRVWVCPSARSIRFAAITTISPAASSPCAAAPSQQPIRSAIGRTHTHSLASFRAPLT